MNSPVGELSHLLPLWDSEAEELRAPEYVDPLDPLGRWRCRLCPHFEALSAWDAVIHSFIEHPELEVILRRQDESHRWDQKYVIRVAEGWEMERWVKGRKVKSWWKWRLFKNVKGLDELEEKSKKRGWGAPWPRRPSDAVYKLLEDVGIKGVDWGLVERLVERLTGEVERAGKDGVRLGEGEVRKWVEKQRRKGGG